MADVVVHFFEINGLDIIPPNTLPEFLLWQAHVSVAMALVSGVFHVIGKIVEIFVNFRRW